MKQEGRFRIDLRVKLPRKCLLIVSTTEYLLFSKTETSLKRASTILRQKLSTDYSAV